MLVLISEASKRLGGCWREKRREDKQKVASILKSEWEADACPKL